MTPTTKAHHSNRSNSDRPHKSRRELAVFILPNLLTTANMFFGFYSIISSLNAKWSNAALAILLATVFDGLDGRVARMTNTQSKFGEEYDSMSDLVSFGMAPAILMYQWALVPFGRMGWLFAFFFLTCAALRLTRFNVLKQFSEKRYFQGLPSPVAAGTVATAVLFYHDLDLTFLQTRKFYILSVAGILAASMISNTRYRSFKDLKFPSQKSFGILIICIVVLILVSAAPEKILFPTALSYVFIGHLSELTRFLRRRIKGFPGTGRS